jgi:hypothetical protein
MTREDEITGAIQAKKLGLSMMGLQRKRDKNNYRREPDVLIPVTTPAQVLSEPHQQSRADPPDFGRPAAPLDY